jgi:hypothetical protein
MEEHKEELFKFLCDMISINTENDGKSGHEKPLAIYIQNKLEKLEIESNVYSPDDIEDIFFHKDYLPLNYKIRTVKKKWGWESWQYLISHFNFHPKIYFSKVLMDIQCQCKTVLH